MSSSKSRPPQTPRPARPRREPLFPLEADDVAPRRRPPQPLRDLVEDLEGALESPVPRSVERPRPVPERPERAAPRPTPPPQRATPQVAVREPTRPLRAAPTAAERIIAEAESLREARVRYDDSTADLFHAERAVARPYRAPAPVAPPLVVSPWMLLIIVVSLAILVVNLFSGSDRAQLSPWGSFVAAITGEAEPAPQINGLARPAGDYNLKAPPSVSAQQIDRILASYNSPATGSGAVWYNLGVRYGIDPAFAVAFFIHESGAGTAQNWAGLKPDGSTTHNVGNIICAGYPTCFNRFRDYPSWEAGIEDWYRLIDVEYLQGRGHRTVADIIPVYAPAFENDVDGYVNVVHRLVDQWRQGRIP